MIAMRVLMMNAYKQCVPFALNGRNAPSRRIFLLLRWAGAIAVVIFAVAGCVDQNAFLPNPQHNKLVDVPGPPDTRPHPPTVSDKYLRLDQLNMNGQGGRIVIKPGNTVNATLNFAFHCTTCKPGSTNQIIIGLAKRSAQACIYQGGPEAQGTADFTLKVPAKPGRYDVRFRGLQARDCQEALSAGWDADTSPGKEATIGMIIVSKKIAPATN
jgi:hypothetical protein